MEKPLDTGTDEALRRWRETRQPEALGELLKRQRDRAYSVARRLMGSQADAEDVVQEAFLKLFSRTHGFEDAEAFELSVYRAVVQCALDALKQGRRRRAREQVEAVERARSADVMHAETREAQAEREELKVLLRDAVGELGADERAPVVLCYQQGLSVSQAARVLELPRETVRARLNRALGALRGWLAKRGKRTGAALIILLLWQDGLLAAPDSLCRSLDAALPGPPCGELPALPQPGPAAAPPIPWVVPAGVGVVAAAVVAGVLCVALPSKQARGPEARSAGRFEAVPERAAPEEPKIELTLPVAPSRPEQKREENQDMRKTLGVLTVAAVTALPFTASAEDPKPEVAQVISAIEARRVAKAEAEAKAQQQNQKRDWREYKTFGGGVAPGGAVQITTGQSGANPGQPVVIELREKK